MIISAHQPAYLPWLGYFDKIAQSDIFVFLDNVQFEKNSFINRNLIKTPQGAQWLTIPVKTKGHLGGSLRDTEIDDRQPWRAKHLKSIEMNYRKAPGFEERFVKIVSLMSLPETNLANFCFRHLQFWIAELSIGAKIVRGADLPVHAAKSDLILALCRHFGADNYLSGPLGRNYILEHDFAREGIKIAYQNFTSPVYPQLWGEFLPNLGVLDWWFNSNPGQPGIFAAQ